MSPIFFIDFTNNNTEKGSSVIRPMASFTFFPQSAPPATPNSPSATHTEPCQLPARSPSSQPILGVSIADILRSHSWHFSIFHPAREVPSYITSYISLLRFLYYSEDSLGANSALIIFAFPKPNTIKCTVVFKRWPHTLRIILHHPLSL